MCQIYDTIYAQLYDFLFDYDASDCEFYQYFIEQMDSNERALEIGSGTGRLLIPYLQQGLLVEGLEPSHAMSQLCMSKALYNHVHPIIHRQRMEELQLNNYYALLYVPLYAFQHLTDRLVAYTTLQRFYEHLLPGGRIIIPLFIPHHDISYQYVWRIRSTCTIFSQDVIPHSTRYPDLYKEQWYDGDIILSEAISVNIFEQIKTQRLKYEFFGHNGTYKTYCTTLSMRWYYRYEFEDILRAIGFKDSILFDGYSHIRAHEGTDTYVWVAIK